jgi:hypothetical protein
MNRSKEKRIVSVSFHGIVYLLLGVLILLNGFIRGELFSSICGTILVAFSLYCLLSVWLSFIAWRRIPLSVEWNKSDVLAIRIIVDTQRGKKPSFLFSRVNCLIGFINDGNEAGQFTVSARVDGIETTTLNPLPARGIYRAKAPITTVSDFVGFFSFYIHHPDKESPMPLVVEPVPEHTKKPEWQNSKAGSYIGKSMYRRSDEFYESRPYTPGDDPRKINWKVYAHTGNLSIRQGDLLPPPSSEYIFLINTQTENEPDTVTRRRFDILINRIANIALELLSQNRIVTIAKTTEQQRLICTVRPDDTDAERKLLNALAIPRISRQKGFGEKPLILPDTDCPTVFFITLPEDCLTEKLIANDNISVIVGPCFEAVPKPTVQAYIRSLFFEDTKTEFPVNPISYQRQLEKCFDALQKGGINAKRI